MATIFLDDNDTEALTNVLGEPALRGLHRRMLEQVVAAKSKRQAAQSIAELLACHAKPLAIYYLPRGESDEHSPWQLYLSDDAIHSNRLKSRVIACGEAARRHGELQIKRQAAPARYVLAAPIAAHGADPEAIGAVFPESSGPADHLIMLVNVGAAHLVLWDTLHDLRERETEVCQTTALLEILAKAEQAPDLRHACNVLVNDLQRFLACRRVAIGLKRSQRGSCRLVSVSRIAQFDKHSSATQIFEAAFDESVLKNEIVKWRGDANFLQAGALSHKRVCLTENATAVITTPLHDSDGTPIGALMLLDDDSARLESCAPLLEAAENSLAASLDLRRRLEGGALVMGMRQAAHSMRKRMAIAGIVLFCLLLAALAIPLPYTIHCNCQIEPTVRRFVGAPFEGTLEKSFVKPGDVVKKGDLLAKLDGREIQWKRAELEAEKNQAAKKRDAALAGRDYGSAQIAKLEMERIDVQLRLLDHQAEHLDIKSPIAGIITGGDLQRVEGAHLEAGRTLFEVAPLEEMIVEIAVPDEVIAYIDEKQEAVVSLDAYPQRVIEAALSKVHPRAEILDQDNVFIAEAPLANDNNLLRPGMKGRAKIITEPQMLGWILFHKPWESVVKFFH